MHKPILALLGLLLCQIGQAQYTETINSNRPGMSSGAFAVGREVLQVETGVRPGVDDHNLTGIETNRFGIDYEVRYGFAMEQLEVGIKGTFLSATERQIIGGSELENRYSNFESNTIGLKYLLYDPYKYDHLEEPNLYSWKANHRFRWKDLIPAISIYAGANLLFGDNPYLLPNESSITPQFMVLTQNNWGRWVFVMNFIGDRVTSDFPTYSGIFTLTHAINGQISVFGEYQAIKNDFYSDDLFRLGGAYLFTKDLQIDGSFMINAKDTPSRWEASLGISYRLDMHSQDEMIMEDDPKKPEEEGDKKQNRQEELGTEGEE